VRPSLRRTFFFILYHSLGNTLQLTDACENWHASASCSSRSSSSACTRFSFPRGHTYPSALLPQSPHLLAHPLYQQRAASLVPGEYRRGLEVHVVHRVCGGERTQAKGVPCCRAHCFTGRVGTWRIRFVQGCALSVFFRFLRKIGLRPSLIFTHIDFVCKPKSIECGGTRGGLSRLSGP